MDRNAVIIITGSAGFIGSCMVGYLNRKGYQNIIIVDDFSSDEKKANYENKKICARVERDELFDWLKHYEIRIDFIFHLGARTDTTEFNYSIHEKLNFEYSQKIWIYCSDKQIPLVYASSAATYGSGELGYNDEHAMIDNLKPLNAYAISKNEFDKWAIHQRISPPFWAGLKFFNVYGPNEYHKGQMASVVFHAFNQIRKTGSVKLFKSHNHDFKDGEQLRDFIYVKDVVDVCYWLMNKSFDPGEVPSSGIYNVGTGKARSFNNLATAVFNSLNLAPEIVYIDTPENIRDKYQYFTQAEIGKLRSAGYNKEFYALENGIKTYVQHFLFEKKYY